MKIVDRHYVLMRVGDIGIDKGTAYLDSDYNFTDDIHNALKAVNRITALDVKHDYEVNENKCYESDLKIVPLNITYEW